MYKYDAIRKSKNGTVANSVTLYWYKLYNLLSAVYREMPSWHLQEAKVNLSLSQMNHSCYKKKLAGEQSPLCFPLLPRAWKNWG
jgi:hypothetical protein